MLYKKKLILLEVFFSTNLNDGKGFMLKKNENPLNQV